MAACCGSRPSVVPARSAASLPLLSEGDGQPVVDSSWAWGHVGDLAQLVCDQGLPSTCPLDRQTAYFGKGG